ncbi:MAG TPA: MaoC family dehydratase [Burkholderiales bacterium]|nr:MaoC family dehydratase [Burkholderiales bacterium]
MYLASIGDRFTADIALNKDEIGEFARLCGDTNPYHHDENFAAKSRFHGIIASGPHLTSLWMAMVARHFSRNTAAVGLEYAFRFRKAVPAGEPITLSWEVIAIEQKASLGGELVSLEGKVTNAEGVEFLTGTGLILVTPKP